MNIYIFWGCQRRLFQAPSKVEAMEEKTDLDLGTI